jgi:hypothetical protein
VCSRVVPVCTSDRDCPREASKCIDGHCRGRPEKPPKGCVKGGWWKSNNDNLFLAIIHV